MIIHKSSEAQISLTLTLKLLLLSMLVQGIRFIPSNIREDILYIYIMVAFWRLLRTGIKISYTLFDILFYIYFLAGLVSFFQSSYLGINLFLSWAQFVILNFLYLNISHYNLHVLINKYMKLLYILIICSIIYAWFLRLFGHMSYDGGSEYLNYFGNSFFSQIAVGDINDLGYAGFYNNPNTFGFLIMLVFLWEISSITKIYISDIISILILLSGIILSNSRGIYICTLIAIMVMIYKKIGFRCRLILSILLVFVVGIFAFIKQQEVIDLYYKLNNTGRIGIWAQMLSAFYKSPIWGNGIGSSKYIISETTKVGLGTCGSYINILGELGIVGMLLFGMLLLVVMKVWIKLSLKRENNGLLFFSNIVFVPLLIYGIIENSIMTSESRHRIWLFVVMIIMFHSKKIKIEQSVIGSLER